MVSGAIALPISAAAAVPGTMPGAAPAAPAGDMDADFLALLGEFVSQTVAPAVPGGEPAKPVDIAQRPVQGAPGEALPQEEEKQDIPGLNLQPVAPAIVTPAPAPAPLPLALHMEGDEGVTEPAAEDVPAEAPVPAAANPMALIPVAAPVAVPVSAPVPAPFELPVSDSGQPAITPAAGNPPVADAQRQVQAAPDLASSRPAISSGPQLQPARTEHRSAPLAFAVRLEPAAAPGTPEAPAPVEPQAVVEAPTEGPAMPPSPERTPPTLGQAPVKQQQAPAKATVQAQVGTPAQPADTIAPEAAPVAEATGEPAPAAGQAPQAQVAPRTLPRTAGKPAQPSEAKTGTTSGHTAATSEQDAASQPAEHLEKVAGGAHADERSAEPEPTLRPAVPRKTPAAANQMHTVEARPAMEMQSEPRTARPEAVAPVAPLEPEPVQQVRATGTASEISLQVGDTPRESVQVKIVEKSGEVHVAVRASDERMADSLRGDLDRLSRTFGQQGYHAETWQPAAASSGDIRQDLQQRQGGNAQAWQDASENGHGQQQDARQQQNRRDTPRWVAELEETNRGDFRSDFTWLSQG